MVGRDGFRGVRVRRRSIARAAANFSVPLQWMLGLRRLRQDAIWLEHLPASGDQAVDVRVHHKLPAAAPRAWVGWALLPCSIRIPASKEHDLAAMRCIGLSLRELRARLAAPSLLLNLSYSLHPPLLLEFERRIFLRSRSERDFLLDDKTRDGSEFAPRVLDDRA
jgi:hypothetical protein